ncbi:MAG: peptide ABC transporter substrate-binding protein [Sarcina sp.]
MVKLKNLCAVALAVAVSATVFVGCGGEKDAGGNSGAAKEQKLIYNLGEDPKTIDPALNASVGGSTILANSFEGLMRLDENDKAIPGVAKEYKISEDKLTYTFTLRDDAKWSDGKVVTAKDFEYAWKRALDPATGAEYAYQLYYIKGGEAFNTKKGPVENVAVKALDEKTLEVTLESPTPYFIELMAFPTYFPVREDVVSNNKEWATKADTYVSNGPFKLTEWRQKDAFVFTKNENYWNKDAIKLENLEMRMIRDINSAYSAFEAGQLDVVDLIPPAQIQTAVSKGTGIIFPQIGTYYYSVNVSGNDMSPEALRNPKVIEALNLAIDREAIVKNVAKGGQIPSTSFVPSGVKGVDGKRFSSKEYLSTKADVEQAKKLLEEAGFPGGEGLPALTLMYNTEGAHGDIAQAVQGMWKEIGVNVELQNQEWKVFQKTRNDGNYNIARDGWVGDYVDPMTFLDLFTSTSGNNNPKYKSGEFDKLISDAKVETDDTKRDQLLKDAEALLFKDMPIIPIYEYTQPKGIKQNIKGVRVSQLGQIYFDGVTVE